MAMKGLRAVGALFAGGTAYTACAFLWDQSHHHHGSTQLRENEATSMPDEDALSRSTQARHQLRGTGAPNRRDFFDRTHESAQLIAALQQQPSAIMVFVGPRSCGKTRLLSQLAAQHYKMSAEAFSSSLQLPGWLDGREAQLNRPASIADELRRSIVSGSYIAVLQGLCSSFVPDSINVSAQYRGVGVGFSLKQEPDVTVAGAVQMARDLFEKYKSVKAAGDPWPLLVLDEANVMQRWSAQDAPMLDDRRTIMAFLVQTTKVRRDAHVILSTSDYSFISWIKEEVGSNNIRVCVLGDFPAEEAREFFMSVALKPELHSAVTDDAWAKIYQVCGGNAGLLVSVGSEYAISGDWTRALKSVVLPIYMDVTEALEGKQLPSGASYTGEEFKAVARMLLDAPPYHAVRWDKLASAAGGVQGASGVSAIERGGLALRAMVEANVLAYRPESSLSRDIPPEVFEGEEAVGSALTPAHLHALRLARNKGML